VEHDLPREFSRKSQLHHAAENGDVDEVAAILSHGAKFDVQDFNGNQALHLAVIANKPNIIRLLLKSGAKVDVKGASGKTPLHLALRFPGASRIILRAHPNLSTPDNDGDTPLHLALSLYPKKRSVSSGVVEKMLRHGAGVNIPNLAGKTPFHVAIEQVSSSHNDSYLPMFLEHEPDILLAEKQGSSPFQTFLDKSWDLRSYWWHAILAFLQKGADPDTTVKREERLLYGVLVRQVPN